MGSHLTYRERYAQLHELEDQRKDLVEVWSRSRDSILLQAVFILHSEADERCRIFLMRLMTSERV